MMNERDDEPGKVINLAVAKCINTHDATVHITLIALTESGELWKRRQGGWTLIDGPTKGDRI